MMKLDETQFSLLPGLSFSQCHCGLRAIPESRAICPMVLLYIYSGTNQCLQHVEFNTMAKYRIAGYFCATNFEFRNSCGSNFGARTRCVKIRYHPIKLLVNTCTMANTTTGAGFVDSMSTRRCR